MAALKIFQILLNSKFHFSNLSFSTINKSETNFVNDHSSAQMNYSQMTIQFSVLANEKSPVTDVTIEPLKPSRLPKSKIPKRREMKPMTSTLNTKMDKAFRDSQSKESVNQSLDSISSESSPKTNVIQTKVDPHDSLDGPDQSKIQSKSDDENPNGFDQKSQETKMSDQKLSEPDEIQKNQIKDENKLKVRDFYFE